MSVNGIDSTPSSTNISKDNNSEKSKETSEKISVFLEDGVIDTNEQAELLEDAIAQDAQLQEAKSKGVDLDFYIQRFIFKAQDFVANTKEALAPLLQRIDNYVNNVKIYANNDIAGEDTVLVAPESVINSYKELKQAELAEKNGSNAQIIQAVDLAYDKFFAALTDAGYVNTDIIKVGDELVNLQKYFF